VLSPFRGCDAVAAGLLSRRQLQGPGWRRLFHDVYASASVEVDYDLRCRAAALLLPPGGALSHRTAAFVHYADVLPLGCSTVEITVPQRVRPRPQEHLRIVRADLPASDLVVRRGLPVTSAVRTAFDLARSGSLVDGVVAVDALLSNRSLRLPTLASYVAERAGQRGLVQARRVVELAAPGVESPMESRLRLVLVLGGLPVPTVQHEVFSGIHFVARVDLAYVEQRLALEYDGDVHRSRAVFRQDVARLNELRMCGWTVLRFTADDVLRRPSHLLEQVRRLLA